MKGSVEHKRYVAKYRRQLKATHWDDLLLFKLQQCSRRFVRTKRPTSNDLMELYDDKKQ